MNKSALWLATNYKGYGKTAKQLQELVMDMGCSGVIRVTCPEVEELLKASKNMLERIDHNAKINKDNGIGEYIGGPAFAVEALRKAVDNFEYERRFKEPESPVGSQNE